MFTRQRGLANVFHFWKYALNDFINHRNVFALIMNKICELFLFKIRSYLANTKVTLENQHNAFIYQTQVVTAGRINIVPIPAPRRVRRTFGAKKSRRPVSTTPPGNLLSDRDGTILTHIIYYNIAVSIWFPYLSIHQL